MPHDLTISKADSWRMFDEISPRYDLLNRLLSFGLDALWRKRLAAFLPGNEGQRVLDVATGTADVLLVLIKDPRVQAGFGVDMAERMLDIGRAKVAHRRFENRISLHHGDAGQLPFSDNTFDAVTIAFGIRNIEDPAKVLCEMRRVLRPEGRALVLEFSLPQNRLLRTGHLLYLRHVVPFVGAVFAGHYRAYRYLNQTIEKFPSGENFCRLMRQAGFSHVTANPLLGGVASIYHGDKI